jgi:CheY-like chemotaxis protein
MDTDNQENTAVLIMRHGDADLKLIRSTLNKIGFAVVNSETGSELSRLLGSPGSGLRLVVADPATPGLDFPRLLRRLHETDSPARVLYLGEKTPDALRGSEHADYIGGHLRRPFRRAHLLASILDATEKPLARTA